MSKLTVFGAAVVSLAIASCEGPGAGAAAQRAAGEFHARFAKKEYTRLYWSADSRFHLATSEAEFVEVLTAVQRKLGDFRESRLVSQHVTDAVLRETTVDLTYQTSFADGQAVETFRYGIDRGYANLIVYNINSPALITR